MPGTAPAPCPTVPATGTTQLSLGAGGDAAPLHEQSQPRGAQQRGAAVAPAPAAAQGGDAGAEQGQGSVGENAPGGAQRGEWGWGEAVWGLGGAWGGGVLGRAPQSVLYPCTAAAPPSQEQPCTRCSCLGPGPPAAPAPPGSSAQPPGPLTATGVPCPPPCHPPLPQGPVSPAGLCWPWGAGQALGPGGSPGGVGDAAGPMGAPQPECICPARGKPAPGRLRGHRAAAVPLCCCARGWFCPPAPSLRPVLV